MVRFYYISYWLHDIAYRLTLIETILEASRHVFSARCVVELIGKEYVI